MTKNVYAASLEDKKNIAKVAYEANRVYALYRKDEADLVAFDEESLLHGVEHVFSNPEITAEALHNEWLDYKKKDGWVYGATKDASLKTHPNIVSFGDLPRAERIKDTLFIGIVNAFFIFIP